jgi:Lrp/AsnC family transcriptional regulator, leucine-responsive regulatory protein
VKNLQRISLDALDVQLLKLLQADADRRAHVLARVLGVSVSTIQRRISSLRRQRVIERFTAVVRPDAVGRPLFLVIQIWLEREDSASVNGFKRLMRETPEVIECFHVTGEHTFIAVICLRNMDEFSPFAERIFGAEQAVKKFSTSVVIARVKTYGAIPIVLDT